VAGTGASKSTRLLVAMLVAGVVFGAVVLTPRVWPRRAPMADVQPQMLVVRPGAKGQVDLGEGLAVSLFDDGLRVILGTHVIFQSVPLGSLVSAGRGALVPSGPGQREQVSSTLDNLEITRSHQVPAGVRYSGRLFDRTRSWPLTLTVSRPSRSAERVDLTVSVPGAQLLVLHSAREYLTFGLSPRLPAVNLRDKAWWAGGGSAKNFSGAAYSTILGSTVGVLGGAPTGVDIRHNGRTDVHVWAPSVTMTVTWYGRTRAGGGLIRPA